MSDVMTEHLLTLTFPPDLALLRVVRLTASSLAADAGFTTMDVEDLVMAVDELTAALVDAAGDEVEISVRTDDLGVTVTGRSAGVGELALDDLAAAIVDRVADRWELRADGFALVKLRPELG
jgi:anti-sigma regulatory factor (Ser/Thr protein kinase)